MGDCSYAGAVTSMRGQGGLPLKGQWAAADATGLEVALRAEVPLDARGDAADRRLELLAGEQLEDLDVLRRQHAADFVGEGGRRPMPGEAVLLDEPLTDVLLVHQPMILATRGTLLV